MGIRSLKVKHIYFRGQFSKTYIDHPVTHYQMSMVICEPNNQRHSEKLTSNFTFISGSSNEKSITHKKALHTFFQKSGFGFFRQELKN